ncbi:MAG: cadherin repeat domain-containing protein, partial [Pseudomonadota bacterium]|nr:cadherin repeat domain-containing protein [Pseudomonadota bacterium]
ATGSDPDEGDSIGAWQIKGGDGAPAFDIDPASGVISIGDAGAIDFGKTSYSLTVLMGDGKLPSHDQTVTISIPTKVNVCHKNGNTLNILKTSVPDHLGHGDSIGNCAS